MNVIIVIQLALLMSGVVLWNKCNVSALPLKTDPLEFTLKINKRPGWQATQQTINTKDPVYQKLKIILNEQQSSWHPNFVTYTPGPYVFRAKGITVDCHENLIVIDIYDSNKSISLKKPIPNLLQRLGLAKRSD